VTVAFNSSAAHINTCSGKIQNVFNVKPGSRYENQDYLKKFNIYRSAHRNIQVFL